MGRTGVAGKWQNPATQGGGCLRVRRPDPGASGLWLARKFHGDGCQVVALLPGRRLCKGGGRNRLPRLKPDRPKNGSKRPSSGFTGLEKFLRVLGLGTPFGT